MEDDLKNYKMEDDLKKLKMEDDLKNLKEKAFGKKKIGRSR